MSSPLKNNHGSISSSSDEGLEKYIGDRSQYVPEAVEAAILELQKRGRVFTPTELHTIREELRIYQQLKENRNAPSLKHTGGNKQATVLIIVLAFLAIVAIIILLLKR